MKAVALILLAVRGPSFFRPEAATPPVISYSLRRAGFCSISVFHQGWMLRKGEADGRDSI
jgi:hypothetical protein